MPGFQFASNACTTPCSTGVDLCTTAPAKPEGGLVSNCSKGYGKSSGGDCVACENTNTLTCTNATVALTCKPGYGLSGGNTCLQCTGANVMSCPAA